MHTTPALADDVVLADMATLKTLVDRYPEAFAAERATGRMIPRGAMKARDHARYLPVWTAAHRSGVLVKTGGYRQIKPKVRGRGCEVSVLSDDYRVT